MLLNETEIDKCCVGMIRCDYARAWVFCAVRSIFLLLLLCLSSFENQKSSRQLLPKIQRLKSIKAKTEKRTMRSTPLAVSAFVAQAMLLPFTDAFTPSSLSLTTRGPAAGSRITSNSHVGVLGGADYRQSTDMDPH